MSETQPTVINNYSIDVQTLISDIKKQEQVRLFNLFLANNVIIATDEPGQFLATSYVNASARSEEDHQPELKLINISFGAPAKQVVDDEPAA